MGIREGGGGFRGCHWLRVKPLLECAARGGGLTTCEGRERGDKKQGGERTNRAGPLMGKQKQPHGRREMRGWWLCVGGADRVSSASKVSILMAPCIS